MQNELVPPTKASIFYCILMIWQMNSCKVGLNLSLSAEFREAFIFKAANFILSFNILKIS